MTFPDNLDGNMSQFLGGDKNAIQNAREQLSLKEIEREIEQITNALISPLLWSMPFADTNSRIEITQIVNELTQNIFIGIITNFNLLDEQINRIKKVISEVLLNQKNDQSSIIISNTYLYLSRLFMECGIHVDNGISGFLQRNDLNNYVKNSLRGLIQKHNKKELGEVWIFCIRKAILMDLLGSMEQSRELYYEGKKQTPMVTAIPETKERQEARSKPSKRAEELHKQGLLHLSESVYNQEEAERLASNEGKKISILLPFLIDYCKEKLNIFLLDSNIAICMTETGTSGSFGSIFGDLILSTMRLDPNVYNLLNAERFDQEEIRINNLETLIINVKTPDGKAQFLHLLAVALEEHIQSIVAPYALMVFGDLAFALEELLVETILDQITIIDFISFVESKSHSNLELLEIIKELKNQDHISKSTTLGSQLHPKMKTKAPHCDFIKNTLGEYFEQAINLKVLLSLFFHINFIDLVSHLAKYQELRYSEFELTYLIKYRFAIEFLIEQESYFFDHEPQRASPFLYLMKKGIISFEDHERLRIDMELIELMLR